MFWMEEADLLVPRVQSQPVQQPGYLSPEAQPSAEHITYGHMLPRVLFLPTLIHGDSQAAEGAAQSGLLLPALL